MDQLKFYKYTIGGLLLLNIAMIAFFIFTKPKHEPRPPRESIDLQAELVRILDLSSEQKNTFKSLADDHNLTIKSINEGQQRLLPSYFETLTMPSYQVNKDSLLTQYQQLERQKMEVTYQHFQDIKSLLSEKQLPQFKEFMRILTDRITGGENRNPPPHGNDNRNPPPPGDNDRNPPPHGNDKRNPPPPGDNDRNPPPPKKG
jgi:hypothetical protein